MPANFLKCDVAQQVLVHCIDSILLTTDTQHEVDNMLVMYAIFITMKWITHSYQIT